ncbi:MAG: KEOPS complex subunit Pcc1 [Halobacteriota archaeon]|uniref:KEOPS complex subunit Pcc1 n=1 Tax=Natronomonas sp. TaxID=2184060 RepID=UPI003975CC48
MHTAELRFQYRSQGAAALVCDAVEREVGEIDGDRATAALFRHGSTVVIEIEADDLVALRAALNTWETLLEVAEEVAETGRPGEVL